MRPDHPQPGDKPTVRRLGRRGFLRVAALAAAPMVLPTGAFGREGRPGANARISTGHIGLGARGRALIDEALRGTHFQPVAVCDVDERRLNQGAALTSAGTKTYRDYREILGRNDLDAVVIATPDHWHAVQAVHACEAGKDVYLETPACRAPRAGARLLDAAAHFGSVVQVGSLARHTPAFAALRAAVPGLGALQAIALWGEANPGGGGGRTGTPPEGLRWAEWIGPGAWRPYSADFAEGGWRWQLDFGGGQIVRQGAQLLETALAAAALDLAGTVEVSAQGTAPQGSTGDAPQPMQATWTFAQPALTITWAQATPEGAPPVGLALRGASGEAALHGLGLGSTVDAKLLEALPEPERAATPDPWAAWRKAIDQRTPTNATLRQAVHAATLVALANLSYRLARPLRWDTAAQVCVDDEVANRMLLEPGSGPWRI